MTGVCLAEDISHTNNNDKEILLLRHKIHIQMQQHTPLSNRETMNKTNVSSAYS